MKRIAKMSVLLIIVLGLFANIGFAAELQNIVLLDRQGGNPLIIEQMLNGLEQAGLVDQQNVMISRVEIIPGETPAQVVEKIQNAKPDVVLDDTGFRDIQDALTKTSIPVVSRVNADPFVGPDGTPTANITGMYTMLEDMIYNSYKFLQKVAPLQEGQQVVFLDNPEFPIIPKELVIDALERLQIPLKAVVNGVVYEDWQEAVLKYSADPEVGWILTSTPTRKRDGSGVDSATEMYPWQQEHFRKPTVTYWEFVVQRGLLCAFGIDTAEVGRQCGKMVARVLQGEPIQSIKAEYPAKTRIALNRKTATELGIVFSMDILKLANVIYDDYEGKDVIQK